MPIRNQIEAIVQTLTSNPTFVYGTANELNLLADDASSFPCVFMYPLQPIYVSPQVNGSVDNTFSVTTVSLPRCRRGMDYRLWIHPLSGWYRGKTG